MLINKTRQRMVKYSKEGKNHYSVVLIPIHGFPQRGYILTNLDTVVVGIKVRGFVEILYL